MKRFTLLLVLLFVTFAHAAERELWLYCPTNLLVDENLDKLETLFKRAHAAGYTHVMLADSKLARLGDLGDNEKRYFKNVVRVKKSAAANELRLVPSIFPVGYSNDILWHDPNLAEGVPVIDTPLVVRDGTLVVDADPAVALSKPAWKDECVKLTGATAALENPAGNARFVFTLKLSKFRCYHVSVKVRTKDFAGKPEIKALGGNDALQYADLGVMPTQEWTTHDVVFDTLDHTDINLYFGVWGDARGTLEWKDWAIEEVAFANVLRRPAAAVTVRDGKGVALREGTDFDRVADPLLGNKPWPGEYTAWHTPPVIKTKLAEGTKARASWFYPPIVYGGQVAIALGEPKTMELMADQFRRVDKAFNSLGYIMAYDELRVANWTTPPDQSAGKLLADHVHRATALLGSKTAYVWSDMFDPHHNAKAHYYLVRGDLAGAWEGVGPNVVIVNWNFGERDASLAFFADRGHRQLIAAYYDAPLADTKAWLTSARAQKNVVGLMYTTWRNDYSQLEAFAELCKTAK